jgi:hypothetical protein
MKVKAILVSLFASAFVLLLTGSWIFAQSGGVYELVWESVDPAAGTLVGGAYTLASTIGQPEPGLLQSGGGYSLNGGVVDAGGSPQNTATPTATLTSTQVPTGTPTATPTGTQVPTGTPTATPTGAQVPTATPTSDAGINSYLPLVER